jgi:hypothetical protein
MKTTLVKKDWDYTLFNYTWSGSSVTPSHAGNKYFEVRITRPMNLASNVGSTCRNGRSSGIRLSASTVAMRVIP